PIHDHTIASVPHLTCPILRSAAASVSHISSAPSHASARPPRTLHSFPTRRSSDLHPSIQLYLHGFLHHRRQQQSHPLYILGFSRSEEHTSELQSRFDLVCRLLLEKKKPRRTNRSPRSAKATRCSMSR